MSLYKFMVVHNPLIPHEVALKQAREVFDQFTSTRKHLVYSENIKDEYIAELSIETKEGASVGQLFVLRNSVVFMLSGSVAAEEAWNMETDVVDLMESAFPESRLA